MLKMIGLLGSKEKNTYKNIKIETKNIGRVLICLNALLIVIIFKLSKERNFHDHI
jgi:hypothetical protein